MRATFTTMLLRAFLLFTAVVLSYPEPQTESSGIEKRASSYWVENITRQGAVAYGNDTTYKVYRNVKDYGATGDGTTDDTAAINKAIADGNRCGLGCDSSTTTPAIVYFPAGTYLISAPVVMYYYTQMIGDALTPPTIKGAASFTGLALLDADPYIPNGYGATWYTNQNNFFRQVRNFVIDMRAMPETAPGGGEFNGIHWQVAQATSLQNIVFQMSPATSTNKQRGLMIENGSGGFMSDLTFNGGNIGAFIGSQQFTTRNFVFNNCNTAIMLIWDWLWTFKSVTVTGCQVGLNISSLSNNVNQTVGSAILMDSKISAVVGISTSHSATSSPLTGGTLLVQNVDFTGSTNAIVALDGTPLLTGGALVAAWGQGHTYLPASGARKVKRGPPQNDPHNAPFFPPLNGPHHLLPWPMPQPPTTSCTRSSLTTKAGTSTSTLATSNAASKTTTSATSNAASKTTTGQITTVSSTLASSNVAGNTATTKTTSTSSSISTVGSTTSTIVSAQSSSYSTYSTPSAYSTTTNTSGNSAAGTVSATTVSGGSNSASGTNTVGATYTSGASNTTNTVGGSNTTSTTSVVASSCAASAAAVSLATVQAIMNAAPIPSSLMDASGRVFERSKPQYETVAASSFVSVKSFGAKGDGVTDDTVAIQAAMNGVTANQILYFDHGAYVITQTVNVPKVIRITGEIWPMIMIGGSAFQDQTNPKPGFRVGAAGDTGAVEITDLIFETKGPAPGAIMMEWNVADSSKGSCGMWDVHFRVGGTAGTDLQQDKCLGKTADSTVFKSECAGSFLMMHVTQQATAYFENTWFWVADHDLDSALHNQTNIYNGRGVLIESQGPVWLYGTASEHSQLYNYQLNNAKNIFMAAIQTETAYMQSAPNALQGGFTPNSAFSDPDFANCTGDNCKKTWGLRVVDSTDVFMYGGGLYSFFDNYDQTCLATESCQQNMVDIECSSAVYLYGLVTKASTNQVVVNGAATVKQIDNSNLFGATVLLFEQQ